MLDSIYEKSSLDRVREEIDEYMKDIGKVKFAETMKETLINNQSIFKERGDKYIEIIPICAIYPEIIEAVSKNNSRTTPMKILLNQLAEIGDAMEDETKEIIRK